MNYLKKITVLLTALLVFSSVFSQNNKTEHYLDKEYQKCLQENLGNLGERNCHSEFEDKWDKEMNRLYVHLIKLIEMNIGDPTKDGLAIDSTSLIKLKTAQQQWLKYRDEEFKLSGTLYNRKGSMFYTIHAYRRMDFVRTRALELKYYCSSFQ